ncbi:MAG: glycosyltransferase family 2 protein, partial [Candidatus Hydrogenedentota bacterium]
PRFFLYYEETDLCKRTLDHSWELWAVGEAAARHAGGASSSKEAPEVEAGGCIPSHFYQSRYYYLTKHYGWRGTGAQLVELAILGTKDAARFILRRPAKHELRRRLQAPIFQRPPEVAYSARNSASHANNLTPTP